MMRPKAALSWAIVCLGIVWANQARAKDAAKPFVSPDKILKKTADRHSVKTSLAVALAEFAVRTGIEVKVDWKTLEAAGVKRKTPVAFDVKDLMWRQVLDVMLSRVYVRGTTLAWRVEDGGIFVTTQKQILSDAAQAAKTISDAKRPAVAAAKKRANLLSTVQFSDVPLKDVLKFFQNALNENFHVNWKAMQAAGITKETPVSLNLKHISAGRALDLALSEVNADKDKLDSIYWIIDRGVVLISTGADFNRTMVTRVIDAGTSTMVVPDTVAPKIDFAQASKTKADAGGGGGGGNNNIFNPPPQNGQKDKSYAELKKDQQDAVIESIKSTIGKDLWEPDGKGTIRFVGNKLVITQSLLGFKLMERALR